jgi:hypothetical protein
MPMQTDDRRRSHRAALLQLAAEMLRRNGRRDADAAGLARALERSAAVELAVPRRDPAAAV